MPRHPRRAAWRGQSGSVDWELTLDRSLLLPGRLVAGHVALRASGPVEARGLLVSLIAEEHWRFTEPTTDAQGHTSTRVVTRRSDVIREPVQVRGPLRLAAGESLSAPFEMPVPGMGPASLQATEAGLDWTIEAKLDIAGGMDSGIDGALRVAQPTALLRAGAVRVGEFALYDSADVADGDVSGSIQLEPVPLVCGAPFRGRVMLRLPGAVRLQEVRAELVADVKATVGSGRLESITAWSGVVAPAGTYGGDVTLDLAGDLLDRALPTVELPHGRPGARFVVTLARAWALDTHLARDVAVATTAEV